jgi:hypothetical protein
MLFSIYKMFTPDYKHLGFPNYFRIELTVLKILGVATLLISQIPVKVMDLAYAGFCFVFISASVTHFNSDDTVLNAIEPLFIIIILAVSNQYMHKLSEVTT